MRLSLFFTLTSTRRIPSPATHIHPPPLVVAPIPSHCHTASFSTTNYILSITMNPTAYSCELDVGPLDAEQVTRLLGFLRCQISADHQHDTDAGTIKLKSAWPIRVRNSLYDCFDNLTVNDNPDQREQQLKNAFGFSATDDRTKKTSRFVILHHPDRSKSVISNAELMEENGSIFIKQYHPRGHQEATVYPGTLDTVRKDTVGSTSWSRTTIKQDDSVHTGLTMSMERSKETGDEDEPSQESRTQ